MSEKSILELADFKSIKQEISKLMDLQSFDEIKGLMETLKNWKATTEALKTSKIGVFVTGMQDSQVLLRNVYLFEFMPKFTLLHLKLF